MPVVEVETQRLPAYVSLPPTTWGQCYRPVEISKLPGYVPQVGADNGNTYRENVPHRDFVKPGAMQSSQDSDLRLYREKSIECFLKVKMHLWECIRGKARRQASCYSLQPVHLWVVFVIDRSQRELWMMSSDGGVAGGGNAWLLFNAMILVVSFLSLNNNHCLCVHRSISWASPPAH